MKVLVTGAGGQLGRAVVTSAARRGLDVAGFGHAELPVENRDVVARVIRETGPDAIVHCAAWTDVDGCERDPARAELVNAAGTAHIAAAAAESGAALVYVSTDFVFDGSKREPYRVDDATNPVSAYGRSKLDGEAAVLAPSRPRFLVVRTSWVFGPGGKNFPAAILARARSGQALRVVDDQVGCPTMTLDLAEALLDLAISNATSGIYHACNRGQCSWYEFAVEILAAAGLGDVVVDRISSAELDRPARRPAYSVLDTSRLDAVRGPMPDFRSALARYLAAESS